MTTRNAGLAGQIEADLLAGSKSKTSTTHCRLCNGGMVYNGRDYCSDRCAQYATDGVPPHDPAFAKKVFEVPLRSWRVIAGPPNVKSGSSHYGDVFDAGSEKFKKPGDGAVRMKSSKNGFMIKCAKCGEQFESKGTSRHEGCKGAAAEKMAA